MLKRCYSIKEIEVYLLCEILVSKDILHGQKTVASLLNGQKQMPLVFSLSLPLKMDLTFFIRQ